MTNLTEAHIDELMELVEQCVASNEAYQSALKVICEQTGRHRAGLNRYIRARVRDKIADLRAELSELEQLDLDFGERGEGREAA